MIKKPNCKCKNVIAESTVTYLRLGEPCQKKVKNSENQILVKPVVHNEINYRCQLDLVDLQSNPDPDRNMKFILVFQDHLTKFVLLRSLHDKKADELAFHLYDIFTTFRAPNIFYFDSDRVFCNQIIKSLCEMWNCTKLYPMVGVS